MSVRTLVSRALVLFVSKPPLLVAPFLWIPPFSSTTTPTGTTFIRRVVTGLEAQSTRTTGSSSSSSITMLSRGELRRKRLAALGVVEAAHSPTPEKNTMVQQQQGSTTTAGATAASAKSSSGSSSSGGGKNKKENHDVIIDLCSSSNDEISDKEEEGWKQQKKKKPKRKSRSSNDNKETGRPVAAPASAAAADSKEIMVPAGDSSVPFQVATWNVWFGPHNGPNPHVKARMTELTRLLKLQEEQEQEQVDHEQQTSSRTCNPPPPPPPPPLWFVGFQEVTDEAAPYLQKTLPGYRFIRQRNSCGYYCLLAVRQRQQQQQQHKHDDSYGYGDPVILDAGWIDYDNSAQGRGFCYVRVRLPTTTSTSSVVVELLVATTHLESYCNKQYDGVEQRQGQLLQFEEFAQQQLQRHSHLKCCLFMGDLNWDDESKSAKKDPNMRDILTRPFADVWLVHSTSQNPAKNQCAAAAGRGRQQDQPTCYTYDGRANPMLNNSLKRRFDRCLVFGRDNDDTSSLPQTIQTQLLGTSALPGLTFQKVNPFNGKVTASPVAPSDHFGFVASLRLDY